MRKPDDNGRLQDILEAINRIESYLRGSDEKKFTNDLMRQDAIVRQIEIIGEVGISRQIFKNTTQNFLGRR